MIEDFCTCRKGYERTCWGKCDRRHHRQSMSHADCLFNCWELSQEACTLRKRITRRLRAWRLTLGV